MNSSTAELFNQNVNNFNISVEASSTFFCRYCTGGSGATLTLKHGSNATFLRLRDSINLNNLDLGDPSKLFIDPPNGSGVEFRVENLRVSEDARIYGDVTLPDENL